MATTLDRTTFNTSRVLDFFSEKELTTQTGSPPEQWPLVVVKELVDNALDACEEAGVPPRIDIVVDDTGITVTDNGSGIPPETVAGTIDFTTRVSSREAYVAPDRGAQGNALMTIVAMPFVLDGTEGVIRITAAGVDHRITVTVDPIRQVPLVRHERADVVTDGTTVTAFWPDSACSLLRAQEARFLQLVEDYAVFNPHASLTLDCFGDVTEIPATDVSWKKWVPNEPTSPHWYGVAEFERLVAAYLAHDADRGRDHSVREFVTEFRGLSGTAKAKAILEATRLSRTNLSALANGHLDSATLDRLLAAMKAESKPPKPTALGVIGKDHITDHLLRLSAEPESVSYQRKVGTTDDGIPWVVETAFGWCPDFLERRLVLGVNWSPALGNPFRQLGAIGRSLDTVLAHQRAQRDEPVAVVLHLACARVRYTDRGKSAVVVDR